MSSHPPSAGDLFWPGDERAGRLLSQEAFLEAMIEVEQAWLDALTAHGAAPAERPPALSDVVGPGDIAALATGAEAGGNPVMGLVRLLRERCSDHVHRGLTSQDVVDTALMLCLRRAVAVVRGDLADQVRALARLAEEHRETLMAGRTLGQHAVPITFGLKAATWLGAVLDAAETVAALHFPAQLGGAAGTLSAATELTARDEDPAGAPAGGTAAEIAARAAGTLGLEPAAPWHTSRAAFTRVGDALVTCTGAWGKIATDVITLSRPEIGELAEPGGEGRGGSSTMPHKHNPVLSVLVRRAALTNPELAATLHLTAGLAEDERATGGWHAEWATLRDLGRRTVVAGAQTTELVTGLRVDAERMATTARAAWDDLTAERDAVARHTGQTPSEGDYLGVTSHFIDSALARANAYLEDS